MRLPMLLPMLLQVEPSQIYEQLAELTRQVKNSNAALRALQTQQAIPSGPSDEALRLEKR